MAKLLDDFVKELNKKVEERSLSLKRCEELDFETALKFLPKTDRPNLNRVLFNKAKDRLVKKRFKELVNELKDNTVFRDELSKIAKGTKFEVVNTSIERSLKIIF
jgi:hypothetical protein